MLIVVAVIATAIGWIVGESLDRPWLRRVCGPLFALLIAIVVWIAVVLDLSFSNAIAYSGATKKFVAAVVSAIDRGQVEEAHRELRKFDAESIETYEGGALLDWLREPTERLNALPPTVTPTNSGNK